MERRGGPVFMKRPNGNHADHVDRRPTQRENIEGG